VDPFEPSLRNLVTQSGIPLWADGDPAHLTREALKEHAGGHHGERLLPWVDGGGINLFLQQGSRWEEAEA
jgi:hypothetical protein